MARHTSRPALVGSCASMEQVLTLVCKIQPSDDEHTHLEETLQAFADACTYI
jgi:hypothetical protein